MADENRPAKKVDEDWKRRMAEEREVQQQAKAAAARPAQAPPPLAAEASGAGRPPQAPESKPDAPEAGTESTRSDPRFLQFLQGVAAQALMAMGQIEGMPEPDLRQAKMVIDTLVMIEEKTRGNLSRDEERALKGLLQELQSVYVQMAM